MFCKASPAADAPRGAASDPAAAWADVGKRLPARSRYFSTGVVFGRVRAAYTPPDADHAVSNAGRGSARARSHLASRAPCRSSAPGGHRAVWRRRERVRAGDAGRAAPGSGPPAAVPGPAPSRGPAAGVAEASSTTPAARVGRPRARRARRLSAGGSPGPVRRRRDRCSGGRRASEPPPSRLLEASTAFSSEPIRAGPRPRRRGQPTSRSGVPVMVWVLRRRGIEGGSPAAARSPLERPASHPPSRGGRRRASEIASAGEPSPAGGIGTPECVAVGAPRLVSSAASPTRAGVGSPVLDGGGPGATVRNRSS